MIQSISAKYTKCIGYPFFILFYLQSIILPLHAAIHSPAGFYYSDRGSKPSTGVVKRIKKDSGVKPLINFNKEPIPVVRARKAVGNAVTSKPLIGGPTAPEASSFKAVGADNLVNLFSGDFSYSIPLMDVGGYPVNLFYNGGITPEQEASWVGLGWNINPGTVNRSLRGVPDDFNGDDKLIQTQNAKPNRTWGAEVGVDGELFGKKTPKLNFSLGISHNNYLGPAFELGAGVSLNIPIIESVKGDKSAPPDTSRFSPSLGLNAKLSSRSGLTFSPSLGMNATLNDKKTSFGLGLSTSYNSRVGIRELNLGLSTSVSTTSDKDVEKSKANGGEYGNAIGNSLASTTISFARPSYIPALKMPMQYANYSGQLEAGLGMWGVRIAAHAQGYFSESKVPVESRVVSKSLVGFMYSENAIGNDNAVMDFNRVNDGEVTPKTPIISATQYAYDLFTIQGEGTGGMIRAYRSDIGFMKDNETTSKDLNISIGVDFAPSGHFGLNWNVIKTPTRSGAWKDGENLLNKTMLFSSQPAGMAFEKVYFRSPGEATVSNAQLINRIGGDDLVRFQLEGSNANPRLVPKLERFDNRTLSSKGTYAMSPSFPVRDKRTQVTTMLTAAEASLWGLERSIRNYSTTMVGDTVLSFTPIPRTLDFRKPHHISEIDVLEASGMRYVYGLPVYNVEQKEYTFSVSGSPNTSTNIVAFDPLEAQSNSTHMDDKSNLDGYIMTQKTPAYASSFLITGLISPDYVDVTGNGITEDDMGTAVKFDYIQSPDRHRWRTPRDNSLEHSANFNEGLRSEKKDNKAVISYGEREVWYMRAIESKSMIAFFQTDSRNDAKGVISDLNGQKNNAENANRKLTRIDLYNKAEIVKKGFSNARPVKTVHFVYSYSLCNGTPDNITGGGKLTLDSIYFTFNGQSRGKKNLYVFNYGNKNSVVDNPPYAMNSSDKWGTFKNPASNPSGLPNSDFPYVGKVKSTNDQYAAAWALKKVLLPSGGQMEMQYEADDYGYVQDRRASDMYTIYGLGQTENYATGNALYNNGLTVPGGDNNYVYIQIPQPLERTDAESQKKEISEKYLSGVTQLAFKLLINMPKGQEPLTVYPTLENYGLCPNSVNKNIIYLKLKPSKGNGSLATSAIEFIIESLPGQAFPAYDVQVHGLKAFIEMAGALIGNIRTAFTEVNNQIRSAALARTIVLNKSFVRLTNPAKKKFGGGYRVKKIMVRDNWDRMKAQFGSLYGQEYDYTTTEKTDGRDVPISSGVASYEPSVGSEENPFREIISFNDKMPLASAQYGAVEMPLLEAFYPSPSVGYSKVTVRSIHRKGTHGDSTLRSGIGKQVTEFYTAREYPARSVYTPMNSKDYHLNTILDIFYKQIVDRRIISQGFLVETNDMHGKMRSQKAYSESDENTPLSSSYHTYKNTGQKGLNDKIDFVDQSAGGTITQGIMGVDMELMTDVREYNIKTKGKNGQLQTDFFTYTPFPVFCIPQLFLLTETENRYRAVSCTKLINYHAIDDSVIVMDKGSTISTKTIAYDIETGAPIITKTLNQFRDTVYNTTYPAYWAYSGMGPAYKNAGRVYQNVNYYNGKIVGISIPPGDLESGDELQILTNPQGTLQTNSCNSVINTNDAPDNKLWVFNAHKNISSLTDPAPDFYFMDRDGKLFTRNAVTVRIIRSGKKNMLGTNAATVTSMTLPVSGNKLIINQNSKVITASAVEYNEKRADDAELFKRLDFPEKNKIINGDFEGGLSGFTTAYPSASYNIGTTSNTWNAGLSSCHDKTTGTGNFLMLNEVGQGNVNQWVSSTITTITPNTVYKFSGWFNELDQAGNNPGGPQITVKINGVELTGKFNISGACNWQQWSKFWNSGTATSAVITISDTRTNGSGVLGIDDLYFGKAECSLQPWCTGILDTTINPYTKGILGNYKGDVSKTFYGNRKETSALIPTNVRANGFLDSFKLYWDFNVMNNLVPDTSSAKWVWTTKGTRYNSKGMELETKDALEIYTSAQYVFNKTMPSAITQNARYGESFYDGFESYNFNESLYGDSISKCKNLNYIDFSNLKFGSIYNVPPGFYRPHSGLNVLKVEGNQTAIKALAVRSVDSSNFNLIFKEAAKSTYINPGQIMDNYEATCADGKLADYDNSNNINVNRGEVVYSGQIDGAFNAVDATCTESAKFKSFLVVSQEGNYSGVIESDFTEYKFLAHSTVNCIHNEPQLSIDTIVVRLYDSNNNLLAIFNDVQSIVTQSSSTLSSFEQLTHTIKTSTKPIYLVPGIYHIEMDYAQTYSTSVFVPIEGYVHCFSWKFNTSSFSLYLPATCPPARKLTLLQDLLRDTTCPHLLPIRGEEQMLNPTFSLRPGKQLLLSAWVHENCAIPCTNLNFSNSKIKVKFDTGGEVELLPSGALIEGWQKVEGVFTPPPNAETATIHFINNSSQPNWFDDIRVQPFNSNMKSSVYDPQTMRLTAELDANNYATFYEYDEEGQLVRVKKETAQGIKTITETRSAKQQVINTVTE